MMPGDYGRRDLESNDSSSEEKYIKPKKKVNISLFPLNNLLLEK